MWGDKSWCEQGWHVERLTHLFNSEQGPQPRGRLGDYAVFSARLAAGSVAARPLEIECVARRPTPPPKGEHPTPEWQLFKRCRRGGSDLHGWLKWFAYHWLTQEFGVPPELEVTLAGYGRADICLGRVQTVVECGNTSPGHAMRLFQDHRSARFVVLPFQRAMLDNLGPRPIRKLVGIEFTNRSPAAVPPAHPKSSGPLMKV